MNYQDEELQHKIENNLTVENSADAIAYRKIFQALGKDGNDVPPNFADRVILKIEKQNQRIVSKDFIWLSVGLCTMLVATLVTILLTGFSFSFGAFKFLSGSGGILLFLAVLIGLFNYLDKNLVKKRLSIR